MHAIDLGAVVNAGSGLLFIGLGLFVALIPASGPANRAFAVVAIAFGATWTVQNLFIEGGHLVAFAFYTSALLLLVASAALAVLASVYPLRLPRLPAATWGVCAGVFAFVLLLGSAVTYDGILLGFGLIPSSQWTYRLALWVFHSVLWSILFLFAIRLGVTADPRSRRAYVLMSAALLLYPAYFAGGTLGLQILEDSTLRAGYRLVHVLLLLLAYAAVWMWSLRGQNATLVTRNVPLLAMSLALAGMAMNLAAGNNNPGYGLSRTLMVVVLAYAIVRHQLLGIDVKVRWGISKTTLAGIFVAVFFVASEVAQQFFGERLGGPYVGIIAAGLLVFAIAPLSRFADRVAATAVPLPSTVDGDQAAYRFALVKCLADGRVSREEERHLARLATRCGLSVEQALTLREDVETELSRATRSRKPGRGGK